MHYPAVYYPVDRRCDYFVFKVRIQRKNLFIGLNILRDCECIAQMTAPTDTRCTQKLNIILIDSSCILGL